MPAPEVSIIIPLYNSVEWLAPTLETVQKQTIEPDRFEIIVVDNASTDDGVRLARIILSTGRSPFHLLRLDRNAGPGYARNAGWRLARAPWIQFLDADDLLVPCKLEYQMRTAQVAPAEVAVVYSEWQDYVLDGAWKPAFPLNDAALEPDLMRGLLETENFLQVGSYLMRRDWLTRVGGFDERSWNGEDVEILLRLAMEGGRFLRAPAGRALLYYRRRGKSSLSRRCRSDFLNACVANFLVAEKYWRCTHQLTPDRLDFLISSYEPLLHNLIAVDQAGFDRLLAHVLSLNPRWKPAYDTRMRLLSSFLGYRRAAQIALDYRRWKTKLSKIAFSS